MRIGFVIALLFSTAVLFAQGPVIEAAVNKSTVEVGEVFTYQIIANQDCPVTAPDFGELEVVGGPDKGYSSSSVTVNNVTKNENQYTLTFHLRANKKGTYNIPPASMKCKLKKVNSGQSIEITVTGSGSGNNQTASSTGSYFFKITSDKNSVYVGEPFVLTLKFYSTKKPSQIEAIENGNASGIYRKDLNPNRLNYTMTQENIKGAKYYVLELKQELCIPERAGKITIEPYYASLLHSVDLFTTIREDGKSNSLTIDVKKLPADTPEDFNGLVGKFNLIHTIDKTSLTEGEALEFNLEISGTGNFNGFDEPKLKLPSSFMVIDPEVTDETSVSSQGIKGKINYKYFITPTEEGNFEISPFSFSYFDTGEKRIRQCIIPTIKIHVEKGDENRGVVIKGQKPIEIENTDIQFIHQQKGVNVNTADFVFGTLPYNLLLIVPPVLVLLVMFAKRRVKSSSPEEKLENTKKSARKNALKNLARASQSIKAGDHGTALKMMQNSLITYLMTKLDLSLSGLSLKSITAELENRKTDTALLLELSHVWKKIEMAQYAPVSAQNLEDTVKETSKLIDALDGKI